MAIKFRGVDFLEFDALLSDDERLVRDTTRRFIEDNLIPIIEDCNRAGRFPRELVKPMADLGFFGDSLKGEKMWITSGSIADVAIIWAKNEEEDDNIRGFLVETNRPGFRAEDIHGKWSLRASVTSSLSLQDVRIPQSNLLPASGGLKSPLMCLNQARYGIAWGAVGAAMACYDCALQYSLFRKQFREQPIASHQLVQEKLAWMISEITKGQLLVLQVGRLKDKDRAGFQHISMAKRNNVWMALECERRSRDLMGANGVTGE